MTNALKISNLAAHYGNIQALSGVNLEVNSGEIVTLIGANGAGKSTLLMSICGVVRASKGSVIYEDQDITKLPVHQIIRLGIRQSPEGRRIFSHMSVLENLKMGAFITNPDYFEEDLQHVFELFPRLKERESQRGGTLSGGEQQMLAIARALMGRPHLLLLDEPSLGLAPLIVKQIFEIIERINQENKMTIFLVEQNAFHALRLADRAYVLAHGEVVRSGSGEELLNDPEVKAAYLGGH